MHYYLNSKILKGKKIENGTDSISFVNNFKFKDVKRFYCINLRKKNIIRAFHGHMKEKKYLYVSLGTALICLVPILNPKNPTKNVKIKRIILDESNPKILVIPEKYANGFKSLTSKTQLIFFSNKSVKESENDDYRYDKYYFGKDIWKHDA